MYSRRTDYLHIASSIALAVNVQLTLQSCRSFFSSFLATPFGKIQFAFGMLLSPWGRASLLATFLALFLWIAATSRFELSYVWPFMNLYVAVAFLLGVLLLNELVISPKIIGFAPISIGTMVVAHG